MPYNYTLTTLIPASSQEVYEAWLDSVRHSEMTGSEAMMSDEIASRFPRMLATSPVAILNSFRTSASCSRGARPSLPTSMRTPSSR